MGDTPGSDKLGETVLHRNTSFLDRDGDLTFFPVRRRDIVLNGHRRVIDNCKPGLILPAMKDILSCTPLTQTGQKDRGGCL